METLTKAQTHFALIIKKIVLNVWTILIIQNASLTVEQVFVIVIQMILNIALTQSPYAQNAITIIPNVYAQPAQIWLSMKINQENACLKIVYQELLDLMQVALTVVHVIQHVLLAMDLLMVTAMFAHQDIVLMNINVLILILSNAQTAQLNLIIKMDVLVVKHFVHWECIWMLSVCVEIAIQDV